MPVSKLTNSARIFRRERVIHNINERRTATKMAANVVGVFFNKGILIKKKMAPSNE